MFHLLTDDYKYLLRSFRQVQVLFVRRFANGVAHLLVQAARSLSSPQEWFISPPSFISHVMLVVCSYIN